MRARICATTSGGTALAMTMADTRPPQDSSSARLRRTTTAQARPDGTRASTFFDATSMIATSFDGPFAV
jgi:hypothetical protein